MRISDILAAKGQRVETTWPAQSARELPGLMVERKVASLVVVNTEGRPLGVVTERNLLEAMSRSRGDLNGIWARDVMTAPPPTCAPSDDVVAVLGRMTTERVRHFIVMDGERMTGLVSIGDLVKHRLADTAMEARILRDMAQAHLVA